MLDPGGDVRRYPTSAPRSTSCVLSCSAALSVYRGTKISNAVRDGLLCPMGPETPQQCWSAAYEFRTMLHEWWRPIVGILYEPSNYWHGRGSRCVSGNRDTGIVRFYPGGLGLRYKAYKVVLSARVPTFYLAFYELMVQSKSSVYPTAARLVPGGEPFLSSVTINRWKGSIDLNRRIWCIRFHLENTGGPLTVRRYCAHIWVPIFRSHTGTQMFIAKCQSVRLKGGGGAYQGFCGLSTRVQHDEKRNLTA